MKRFLKFLYRLFFQTVHRLFPGKPYLLLVYSAAQEQRVRPLIARLQSRYGVLEWSLPAEPGRLAERLQWWQWRYPSLQHSLLLGKGSHEAYSTVVAAGLPRVSVWWEDEPPLAVEAEREMQFWSQRHLSVTAEALNKSALAQLAPLLEQAHALQQQEQQELATLAASGQFEPRFFSPTYDPQLPEAYYLPYYVRHWHSGIEPRKPRAGFHPGIYAERQQLAAEVEPFAHYLAQQQPAGLWERPVITRHSPKQPLPKQSVALHIHAYYVDRLPELLARIQPNRTRPDLFISVASASDALTAMRTTQGYEAAVQIREVPNRGRDIGPFLTAFGAELVAQYELIGHIHTKQSLHVAERDAVTAWQDFLLDALLGGEPAQGGAMMDACLAHLAAHPAVPILYPDDPKLIGWDGNEGYAEALVQRMGLGALPKTINFPAGTMFWLRAELLQRFVDLALSWEDYPAEPVPKDGTMLHALERLFGAVPLMLEQPYALAWATGRSR